MLKDLKIREALLTNHNAPGYDLKAIEGIVIHWTANTSKGADAMANRNYFQNTDVSASSQYIVDDHEIVRCIPDKKVAWHAGAKTYNWAGQKLQKTINGTYYSPNFFTIGIEMCVNSDGDFTKTRATTVLLTACLCLEYGLNIDQVYRHYDITGKICPAMMVDNSPGVCQAWLDFKNDVLAMMAKLKPAKPTPSELVLKKGSQGDAVVKLQQKLIKLGYLPAGEDDGDYGPKTESAVIAFKKTVGLEPDGDVGTKTLAALDKAIADKEKVAAEVKARAEVEAKKKAEAEAAAKAKAEAEAKAKAEAEAKAKLKAEIEKKMVGPFVDIPETEGQWLKDLIKYAADHGIVAGSPANDGFEGHAKLGYGEPISTERAVAMMAKLHMSIMKELAELLKK